MARKTGKKERSSKELVHGDGSDGLPPQAQVDSRLAALFSSHQALGAAPEINKSAQPKSALPSLQPELTPRNPVAVEHTLKHLVETEARQPSFHDEGSISERQRPSRKRKRSAKDDNLETDYFERLAREERATKASKKRRRHGSVGISSDESAASENDERPNGTQKPLGTDQGDDFEVPQHETLTKQSDAAELEKAGRTVFLGNVSTQAIKSKAAQRELMAHLTSFVAELPPPAAGARAHKVESLRFRSTAFATAAMPKKAAFARQELMDATTQGTHAYAVYSTAAGARAAVRALNGSTVLGRHLRADGVAHPAPVDHRRCVFVGNLGFVDDDSLIKAAEDPDGEEKRQKKKKPKPAADAEEGLWRHFQAAGDVESVRVVRDQSTRIGKGFAYVQFKNENAVEKALLLNDKKFPPMLPRKLRVTRAKKLSKTALRAEKNARLKKAGAHTPQAQAESSLAGRARRLFGKAGAAQRRAGTSGARLNCNIKRPEAIIFEGHRAKAAADSIKGKPPRSMKKGTTSKPKVTSRSAAYKAGKIAKRPS